uniref:Uncharacterized protein n=1 Tax=Romanomermis culicivorax TaxID=13658 RepID=A0A915KN66_ROMCU
MSAPLVVHFFDLHGHFPMRLCHQQGAQHLSCVKTDLWEVEKKTFGPVTPALKELTKKSTNPADCHFHSLSHLDCRNGHWTQQIPRTSPRWLASDAHFDLSFDGIPPVLRSLMMMSAWNWVDFGVAFPVKHKPALHFKLLAVVIMNFGHGIIDHP